MEDIFNKPEQNTKQIVNKKTYKQVQLETTVIEKLKQLNKGSPNSAIKSLLFSHPESKTYLDKLHNKQQDLENDITELQNKFERLVTFNKLRI